MGNIELNTQYIIGVDEVGIGSWAGPLVIGAVRAPENWTLPGLNDSKQLTRDQRAELNQELSILNANGVITSIITTASNTEIDELGLGVCHKTCFTKAINYLYADNDQVILDGNLNPKHLVTYGLKQPCEIKSEVKADSKFPAVMAASIIAKHFRDELMIKNYHPHYPSYGWNSNVGYIVTQHKEAVKQFGLSPLHRKSYKVKL